MTNDDQVFRLICCGVACLGLITRNGINTSGDILNLSLIRQALKMGEALYNEARTAGVWPIVQENP